MTFFRLLLLLFLTVPVLEIYLLIKVGSVIGAMTTVIIVILTAVIGAVLLRYQGLSTLFRAQKSMAMGELPAIELLEGVILLMAGAMLLTPGFFTDTIGFLVLVPAIRRALVIWFLKHNQIIQVRRPPSDGPFRPSGHGSNPKVIEGEYNRED